MCTHNENIDINNWSMAIHNWNKDIHNYTNPGYGLSLVDYWIPCETLVPTGSR